MHSAELEEASATGCTLCDSFCGAFWRRSNCRGSEQEQLPEVSGGEVESVKQRSFRETMLCDLVSFKTSY